MRLARFSLLLGSFLALSSQLSPAFARRVEECKVERVDYLRGPSCAPEAYFEKRSGACGVELYNQFTTPSCVGAGNYKPTCAKWEYHFTGSHKCLQPVPQPAGYHKEAYTFAVGDYDDYYWVKNGRSFTCRAPANGVESYKSCRHPNHDVELFSACIPQPVWNDCAILKTRAELDAFIEQSDRSLPFYGALLLSNNALIAKLTSNANALACLVKEWDGDARYVDLVAQMKTSYRNIAEKEYSESSCQINAPESIACAADDVTEVCVAQRNVVSARDFLRSNYDEVTNLIGDVVPSSDPAYRLRLESLASEIAEHLK